MAHRVMITKQRRNDQSKACGAVVTPHLLNMEANSALELSMNLKQAAVCALTRNRVVTC